MVVKVVKGGLCRSSWKMLSRVVASVWSVRRQVRVQSEARRIRVMVLMSESVVIDQTTQEM